jgi:hypothetical protein
VSGLLPDAVRDAIARSGELGASESFGVVTLVVLVVVLVEHEVLRVTAPARARMTSLFVSGVVLSCAVLLTIGARLGRLM